MERRNPLVRVSCWLIHLYRECAPLRIRNACRFEPTCSNYALICLREYGFWRGWWRTLGRLFRCRPPHGGVDHPVRDQMNGESLTRRLLTSERGDCSEGFGQGCGAGVGFKAAESGSGCGCWVAVLLGLMFLGLLSKCGLIG